MRICTIDSGNTRPGAAGISTALITTYRDSIGPLVTYLFQAYLRFGYNPSYSKLAETMFLLKKKRDLSKADG